MLLFKKIFINNLFLLFKNSPSGPNINKSVSNSLRVCEERGEKVLLHKCTSMRPRLKIKLSHIPLLQSVKISTWPSELLNWTETLHLLETHRQSRIYTVSGFIFICHQSLFKYIAIMCKIKQFVHNLY